MSAASASSASGYLEHLSFAALKEAVASFIAIYPYAELSSYQTRELQGLLNEYRQHLLSPLTFNPPNTDDRYKVKDSNVIIKGVKVSLPSSLVDVAIYLSDELKLNEIECVRLCYSPALIAHFTEIESRLYGLTYQQYEYYYYELKRRKYLAFRAAVTRFREERTKLLHALYMLLQSRNAEPFHPYLGHIIVKFTNELIVNGLVQNISYKIRYLNAALLYKTPVNPFAVAAPAVAYPAAAAGAFSFGAPAAAAPAYQPAGPSYLLYPEYLEELHSIEQERRSLAECLFYICYDVYLFKDEFLLVWSCLIDGLNNVQELAKRGEAAKASSNADEINVPYRIAYSLRDEFDKIVSEASSESFRAAYIIGFAASCALSAFVPRTSRNSNLVKGDKNGVANRLSEGNRLIEDGPDSIIENMTRELEAKPDAAHWSNTSALHAQFRAWFYLVWSLCLYRIAEKKNRLIASANLAESDSPHVQRARAVFIEAVDAGVFDILRTKIVNSRYFKFLSDASNKSFFLYVLYSLVCQVITFVPGFLNKIFEMQHRSLQEYLGKRERYEQLLAQQKQYQPYQYRYGRPAVYNVIYVPLPPAPPKTYFEQMLQFLAEVFRDVPAAGRIFFNDSRDVDPSTGVKLAYFVRYSCPEFITLLTASYRNGYPHQSIVPFMDFLAALAADPHNAAHTFDMLNDTNSIISWNRLYSYMHLYVQQNIEEQQRKLLRLQLQYQYYLQLNNASLLSGGLPLQQGYAYQQVEEIPIPPHLLTTPEHQGILAAMLKLIQKVASSAPDRRLTMWTNNQWNVLANLSGLLNISAIPTKVMGEVMRTLASFVFSEQSAYEVWTCLELSGTLSQRPVADPTGKLPAQYFYQVHAIVYQLEQVESKWQKEYPETIGFLELLLALVRQGVPHDKLGLEVGRAPGFGPYLSFLRDHVFNKYDSRSYVNPGEKWTMVEKCLAIFLELLDEYEPSAADFTKQVITIITPNGMYQQILKPLLPGFEILRDMLSRSLFQQKVLSLLTGGTNFDQAVDENDSAVERLKEERITSEEGKAHESCILQCMKFIEMAIAKQEKFLLFSLNVAGKPSALQDLPLFTRLDNIIVSSPNVVVELCRFLSYPLCAELRLMTVRLLYLLSYQRAELIKVFYYYYNMITRLFVDRVLGRDAKLAPELVPVVGDENGYELEDARIENTVREAILSFLISNIDVPEYSITLLLSGYNLYDPENSDLVGTRTQQPHHCLAAIIHLLRQPYVHITHPRLVYQCFYLIYLLCADGRVCRPTLAYLEKVQFFDRHMLSRSDFYGASASAVDQYIANPLLRAHPEYYLNKRAFLMKSIALDIFVSARMAAPHGYRESRAGRHQEIANLLFNAEANRFIQYSELGADEYMRTPILELLDDMDKLVAESTYAIVDQSQRSTAHLAVTGQLAPEFEKLQQELLVKVSSGEFVVESAVDSEGIELIDIMRLHGAILQHIASKPTISEVATAEGAATLSAIIERTLDLAVRRSYYMSRLASIVNAFDGWKRVVEVTLSYCFDDILQEDKRERVLHEIIIALLLRLYNAPLDTQLKQYLAGAVPYASSFPVFAEYIRQLESILYRYVLKIDDLMAQVILRLLVKLCEQRIPLLHRTTAGKSSFTGSMHRLPVDKCIEIFRGLLYCISSTRVLGSVRANLYAAIVYYVQYTTHKLPIVEVLRPSSNGILDGIKVQEDDEANVLDRRNEYILNGAGLATVRRLLEILFSDAVNGPDAHRIAAITALDALFEYDRNNSAWLLTLGRTLEQFLDSLAGLSQQLQSVLNPMDTKALHALYVYEYAMSLLLKFVELKGGARALCNSAPLLSMLSRGFVFLNNLPATMNTIANALLKNSMYNRGESENEAFMAQTSVKRYHQLLLPMLRVVTALFTHLPDDVNVAEFVIYFIYNHRKVISSVLKDRFEGIGFDMQTTEEARLVTSLFALLGSRHVDILRDRLKSKFHRYENLLLLLLSKYSQYLVATTGAAASGVAGAMDEDGDQDMTADSSLEIKANETIQRLFARSSSTAGGESPLTNRTELARQICRNIVCYCRNAAAASAAVGGGNGGNAFTLSRVLFSPPLGGPSAQAYQQLATQNRPSLSILYDLLATTVQSTGEAISRRDSAMANLSSLDGLSDDQLALEIVKSSYPSYVLLGGSVDRLVKIVAESAATTTMAGGSSRRDHLRYLAQLALSRSIITQTELIQEQVHLVENALFVFFVHFRVFLMAAAGSSNQPDAILQEYVIMPITPEQRKSMIAYAKDRMLYPVLDQLGDTNTRVVKSELIQFLVRTTKELLLFDNSTMNTAASSKYQI